MQPSDLPFVVIQLANTVTASKSREEHLYNLDEIFHRIQAHFHGFIVGEKGGFPDLSKVAK